jgi:hypothetical protein
MAANATNSIDLAIQRQLALLLGERLPDVSLEQEDVEDRAELYAQAVEDVAAENPTLGDLDGVAMFGQVITRQPHDVFQVTAGFFYRWIEIEISATGRYD